MDSDKRVVTSDNARQRRWSWLNNAANWLSAAILLIVPFHGFLTVWGASLGMNYTLLRAWDLVALSVLVAVCGLIFLNDHRLRLGLRKNWLLLSVLLFIFVQLIFAVRGLLIHAVDIPSMLLGLVLNLRGPVFMLCCIILVKHTDWPLERWLKIVWGAAAVVAAFAILQFTVLPHDFLTHFGYGPATIKPYETINDNSAYIRVASTLRGVNPLGAYMAVLIVIIASLQKWSKPISRWIIGLMMVGALTFSFSRSAWIGCFLGLISVVALQLRTPRQWLQVAMVFLGCIVMATSAYFVLGSRSTTIQNIILHTENHSKIAINSNNARYSVFFSTLHEISHEPLGRGVGSAGPASVHNTAAPGRMAENYFLQIAQETGWFGIAVYLFMLGALAMQFWCLRSSPIMRGLLAALIATMIINFLSYAWSDDTLVFTWYGLAGLALGAWFWRGNLVSKT